MRHLIPLSLLALSSPALAQSYGGGGIAVHQALMDWDVPNQAGANTVGCVGAIGYGVRRGRRGGGEGHFCHGPYANMLWGGAHFGIQSKRGGIWANAYNTVGAGWVGVHGSRGDGRFDGMYLFTRPTVGGGIGIGHWAGLEAGAFVNLPVNVMGIASKGVSPKAFFPHVGLQATLLFGDFSRQRKVEEPKVYAPPPPPRAHHRPPPPPRPPAPPPPPRSREAAPIQPGDLPSAHERPL